MLAIFSPEKRILLWRELWIALAQAQKELGLDISAAQIAELKAAKSKIDWSMAKKIESEIRHDVMAHVKTYAAQCPKAAPIIHLGATSTYVTDNGDLILMREGLELIIKKIAAVIDRLATFAKKERESTTLAFTHFQPAQPTTVGKRACLWIDAFVMDLELLQFELSQMRFHGAKGATGTQDSFLKLFDGNKGKAKKLDHLVTKAMGFDSSFPVTGQTYPRKVDSRIVFALGAVCESASKFAIDLRLLQALHEVSEPREDDQVGSSAMPYKQNPMRSERITSLGRYVMNMVGNCFSTAANQWFERTLDDSANRRLVIPQSFLVTDAVLDLCINVASGMKVRHAVVQQNLMKELPFLQTEEILMAAVREGGNRQELHEKIREHSQEVIKLVREKGEPNDLMARLREDPAFAKVQPKLMVKTDPSRLVGMAADQVDGYIKSTVEPIRKKYKAALGVKPKIRV